MLEMILAVVAYLKLCLYLGEEVVVETSMCFPIACLAFTEKKKHAAVFAIAGDIAIYS